MPNLDVTITHRADKQSDIASCLLARITSGELPPGSRIPPRQELATQYAASLVTVQKALRRLQDDGLLVARGRAGTFVAEYPPHLYCYGLVFPERPQADVPWNHYYRTILRAAEVLEAETDYRFITYFGLETPGVEPDTARLLADLRAGRIAGLIFPSSPHLYAGTPVLDEPGVPRVAVMGESRFPTVASVQLHGAAFAEQAAACLLEQGCERIALIMNNDSRQTETMVAPIRRALTAKALTMPDRWCLGLPLDGYAWTQNLLALLMHGDPAERPDGLIIADDNLVPSVVDALLALGLRIPGDLTVVGSANFPWPTPSAAPIHRFGTDIQLLLTTCVAQLAAIRDGATPGHVRIPVRGET